MTFEHCTAERPCWEFFQNGETRVLQAEVKKETEWLFGDQVPTLEFLLEARDSVNKAIDLLGRQWRQMNRSPFDLPRATAHADLLEELGL